MYNMRLKEYNNGTLQLTFYSNPIRSKKDKYTTNGDYSGDTFWDEPTRQFDDCDNDYSSNPFVESCDQYTVSNLSEKEAAFFGAKLMTADEEYLVITDEQFQEKRDRSLRASLNRSKRMIYDYGRSNIWEWFVTFTFQPVESFDKYNYLECKDKVTEWFRNVRRRYCHDIKYLIVPEQHSSGAWHFHALMSNCDNLTFEKAVNNQRYLKVDGSYVYDEKGHRVPNKYFGNFLRTRYPDGDFIYNIKEFQSGFTTATRITDTFKTVSYLVKYITKELCECTFGKRRYLPSNNLELPKVTTGMYAPDALDVVLQDIEYNYKVNLSIDCIKTYIVDAENYHNTITVFEFNPKQVQN